MKLFSKISAAVLGVAATIALVQSQIAVGLSDREVGEVAQEITVRIDGPDNGSGAIVGKEGNTYTVVTNCHVIEKPGTYTIVTHGGSRYTINSNQGICQPGVDLAMLRFTSTRRYRVANIVPAVATLGRQEPRRSFPGFAWERGSTQKGCGHK